MQWTQDKHNRRCELVNLCREPTYQERHELAALNRELYMHQGKYSSVHLLANRILGRP